MADQLHPIVFLSLGPGDPGLLTQTAVGILKDADVVMVPATRDHEGGLSSRATDIIREWCDASRLRAYELPMLKDRRAVLTVYDSLCRDAGLLYRQKRRVVVAAEGDVSIYASIHYVMDRLRAEGIPVVQQPGIPSFIAAAAVAGMSLVSQHQRLTILPGDADVPTLQHLLANGHVVVVMKLSQCQDALKAFLRGNAKAQCHYFEHIGTEREFHTTERQEILSRPVPYFSLCVLSE